MGLLKLYIFKIYLTNFYVSTDVFWKKIVPLRYISCFLTLKLMIYFCLDESVKTRSIVAGKFTQLVEKIGHSIEWHNLGRHFRDIYYWKLRKSA